MRERIGKFEVLQILGKGAMGEVYLARDPSLGREVAVKTIRAGTALGEEAHARFEREARSAGRLSHPNIVTVYEFGVDEGEYYLAMEYVDGRDLDTHIKARSLDRDELLECLAQACEGLAYAHEEGIVHRDIKPANILATRKGKRLVAKLMDFGVALVSHSNLTQQGIWMGTVSYMAPEYLDTGKASPSSDIFAVGVILYEILTGGRKPFTGETSTMVLNRILRHPPDPFSPQEILDLNPALLAVANKALAKDPRDRHATAEQLAAEIREAKRSAGRDTTEAAVRSTGPLPPHLLEAASFREPSGGVLVVSKGGLGHCLSLKVALRQAKPGSQIHILPGTYRESVVVDKDVSIEGRGEAEEVILESVKGPALTLRGPGARLSQLTLRTQPAEGQESAPALLVLGGSPQIANCILSSRLGPCALVQGKGSSPTFRTCRFVDEGQPLGLHFQAGSGGAVEFCAFEGFSRAALRVDGGAQPTLKRCRILAGEGSGLWIAPRGVAELEDCEVEDRAAGGVEVDLEGRAILRRCNIVGSRFAGLLLMDKAQAAVEDCEISGHGGAGIHLMAASSLQMRQGRIFRNEGYGLTVVDGALAALEACEIHHNAYPGVLVRQGGTVQIKGTKIHEGGGLGVACLAGGKGVLEGCEIYGNTLSGARVEPGGSLLLVRCVLRDGRDTGLLLFEDAQLTLEECAVHRNARGGILLARDASDPILRGGNRIEDEMLRVSPQGGVVRVAPITKR